jgi:hypothetical protein
MEFDYPFKKIVVNVKKDWKERLISLGVVLVFCLMFFNIVMTIFNLT